MGRRKRRSFTPEYKAEVIRLVRTSEKSLGQVAEDLDLTESRSGRGCDKRRSMRVAQATDR